MNIKDRIKRIQKHLLLAQDGIIGSNTLGRIEQRLGIDPTPVSVETELDARSEKHIKSLIPTVQPTFREFIHRAKRIGKRQGVDVKIISGTRTYEEQDSLYARGRTESGARVTNARGGYSNHNFGIAIDLGTFREGKYLDSEEPGTAEQIYKEIALHAEDMGIEWGGNWKSFKDTPHFQYKTGYTMKQLREKIKSGEAIV